MLYNLIIKEEALADLQNAYLYYELQQAGLGERFLTSLLEARQKLEKNPQHYSYIPEDPLQVLRDVKLKKFPFVIVLEISAKDVIIYAVHNTSKKRK